MYGFACTSLYGLGRALPVAREISLLRHSIAQTNFWWYWNIYQLSIAYAFCLGLGPDLP